MPRIDPLDPDDFDDQTRRILQGAAPGVSSPLANMRRTLVRHPAAFATMMPFGTALQQGVLSSRHRELLILRTGWNCRAEYEWGQHVRVALAAGLSEDDVERIANGPDAPGWDRFDAAVLRAADELHTDAKISDATWAVLTEEYDDRHLIELCMTVGLYHLVAFSLNSLEVELDDGLARFPEAQR